MGCNSSVGVNPRIKVVLGFWNFRGGPRGNGTRYLLNYCGVRYSEKKYAINEHGEAAWATFRDSGEIPFANLPYLIDGAYQISETLAVQQYIAAKWRPVILGSTPADRAKIYQMHQLIISTFQEKVIKPAINSSD